MIRKPKFMDTLRDNYKKACDAYLHRFCELIEMDTHYADWVDVGGIANIGDYYVSLQDMITAVEHNVGYEQFIKWYDYTMRVGMLGIPTCNLNNWLKGCPTYSEETLLGIEAARVRVRDAEEELERRLKEVYER
jgi:hypothetical protein